MYAEAAGYDTLGAGMVHGDYTRPISGHVGYGATGAFTYVTGVFEGVARTDPASNLTGIETQHPYTNALFKTSRVVPTGNANKPRAWGALACVYLGKPAS
jgi:hypothetical protein